MANDAFHVKPVIEVDRRMEEEYPGSSTLATACVLNLAVLASMIEAHGTTLIRRRGISSPGAFNVLTILAGEGAPLPPSTIAGRMIVTRGTMTALVGTLERHGLVRRTRHAGDGRMRLVEITPEGSARVASLLPELHAAEVHVMRTLNEPQQHELLRSIAALQSGLSGDRIA